MNGPEACTDVCFVAGAGHSGSTLLGYVVGAHPSVTYAGEARKHLFFGNLKKPLRKRACKRCGEDCPVWGGLEVPAGSDVYEALARRTGKPHVLDSTKNAEWVRERSEALCGRGVRVRLLFLMRDGRAVVASRLRKEPELGLDAHTLAWRAQIEAARALVSGFPGPVHPLHYEALASSPQAEIQRLADFLGLSFDAAMLAPWASPQHPLGGNSGTQALLASEPAKEPALAAPGAHTAAYYAAHPRAFVLDLRWQQELDAAARARFAELAGETNEELAWETDAPQRPG
jgi:hypothetical protein